jgi:transcription-repair coupling factor (superfamily II helicase)
LELSATGGLIEFSTKTSVDPAILVHLLESEPDRFRLDRQQRLRVTDELKPADKRFELAAQLVDQFLAAENIPSAA